MAMPPGKIAIVVGILVAEGRGTALQKCSLLLISLIFLFGTVAQHAAADSEGEKCEHLFLRFAPIAQTTQPTYKVEIESAGKIIGPSEPLPALKTGFYIFLILDSGEILFAPKYDIPKYIATGQGLATHKSLLKMYADSTFKSAAQHVVAGGEFQVAFGQVIDISNRSGNFKDLERSEDAPNRAPRLDATVDFFKGHGLAFDPDTKPRAIDPNREEDRGHTPADRDFDVFHLDFMSRLQKAALGPRTIDLYEQLHALILESFPAESPRESLVVMQRARLSGAQITGYNRGGSAFTFPLVTAYSRDGLEFGVLETLRDQGILRADDPDRVAYTFPLQIRNILASRAAEKFLPPLREKWERMAEAFSNLK